MIPYIISALIGYVSGSFPSAYLLVKWKTNVDIRQSGSGSVGTLNAMEVAGSSTLGTGVLVLDMVKGALPVVFALNFLGDEFEILAAAGLSAIIGHSFPVWLKFKGGRGLATTAGVMLVLGWVFIVIWLALWGLAYAPTRSVHAGNIFALLFAPLMVAVAPKSLLLQTLPHYTSVENLLFFSIAFCVVLLFTHREVLRSFVKQLH